MICSHLPSVAAFHILLKLSLPQNHLGFSKYILLVHDVYCMPLPFLMHVSIWFSLSPLLPLGKKAFSLQGTAQMLLFLLHPPSFPTRINGSSFSQHLFHSVLYQCRMWIVLTRW